MKTRFAWGTLVFSLTLVCSPLLASSPEGNPPKDAAEAFAKADAVFLGRVVELFKDTQDYPSMAEVEVKEVWKGKKSLPRFIRIDGQGGPTYPARIFALGETYLFYLPVTNKNKPLRADAYLHRVLTKGDAAGDLEYLSTTRKQ